MKGIFYVVPTPIGNLKDMTLRAIDVLKNSDIIYCEDTRHSRILLDNFDIKAKTISLHKFNEEKRFDEVFNNLKKGLTLSYISDAGTPGISDPIVRLIKKLPEENISVLPGATAFVPALVSSGLDTDRFLFVGFLPQKDGEKRDELLRLKNFTYTLIFYESPHKFKKTIEMMLEVLGDRKVSIIREISKIHEEIIRTTLSKAVSLYELKGEIVIVLEGLKEDIVIDPRPVIDSLLKEGLSAKSILSVLKKDDRFKNIKRNEVYDYILEENCDE